MTAQRWVDCYILCYKRHKHRWWAYYLIWYRCKYPQRFTWYWVKYMVKVFTKTTWMKPVKKRLWNRSHLSKVYSWCALSHISLCEGRIETHHIMYRSEVPNHPSLHHPQNLLLVCRKHHSWLHEKKDRRKTIVLSRNLHKLFPDVLHDRYK